MASGPVFSLPGFEKEPDSFFENALENLNPLEVLGKPSLMVSEGFGAYSETEDPTEAIGAALRAFYRGSDERMYGTMGQQLLPEEPGEGWDAKLKRLGVDLVTDPALLFPGTVGVKTFRAALAPYKYGYKAAQAVPVVGKALPTGAKVADLFWQSGAGRAFSRWFTPGASHIERYGLEAGKEYNAAMKALTEAAEIDTGQLLEEIATIATEAGVTGMKGLMSGSKNSIPALITDAVERGTLTGIRNIDDAAMKVRDFMRRTGDRAEAYRDRFGNQLEVFDPKTGKAIPFSEARIENYMPHRLRSDIIEELRLRSEPAAIEWLKKNYNVQADIAKRLVPRARKAGSLELARTAEIPEQLLERNAFKLLNDYSTDMARRLAYGEQFGLKGERLKELVGGMKAAGLEQDVVEMASRVADGIPDLNRYGLDKVARGIMGFQVLGKMGVGSTISNLSQQTNTVIREGGVSYIKGLIRSMSPSGYKEGSRAWGQVQEKTMRDVLGVGSEGLMSNLADKWLSLSLFNIMERTNRAVAANTGLMTAQRLLKQSGGELTEELARRGVTKEAAQVWKHTGKLPDVDDLPWLVEQFGETAGREAARTARRVGLRASDATQHATRIADVPVAWRTPEVKMMTQFKSFVFQQSRFLGREIISPALKFYRTNGKQGSLAPLYRAGVLWGLTGPQIARMREGLKKGVQEKVFGEKYDPYYEWDWDHPYLSYAKGLTYVGGLGIAADIVTAMQRGKAADWVLGPTFGDIGDFGRTAISWGGNWLTDGELPDEEELYAELYRRTLRGAMPAAPKSVGEAVARRF